jgi:hypothetical protein
MAVQGVAVRRHRGGARLDAAGERHAAGRTDMLRTFSVTVVTEIDFVGSPSDDVVHSHLERLVDSLKEAAESLSTRVTGGVRVAFCGGSVVTSARTPGQ